nr:oligosaccharide flippase family protein [Desulfobacula sp.]
MLKRNLIANYIGQGWAAIMGIAFIPLYIKYLGIESYGLIGLFAVLTAWFSLLDMGMTPALGREMARFTGGTHSAISIRDLLRSIEFVAIGIAMLMMGGVAASANWLASSWLQTEALPISVVAQSFIVMGAVATLRFFEGIYRSSIIGLQRQVLFNIINSTMATLRGLGAVAILAWVSPTIQAFFLWQGLISMASLTALAITTYSILPCSERRGQFSMRALQGVGRFAGGMMGIAFLALLLTQMDKILLSKLLTLSDYGYYTLAAAVAGSIGILISPITQAYFPLLSRLHAIGDHAGLIRVYHQGAQLVSVIAGSASVVLLVFTETFLNLWTQDTILVNRTALLLRLMVLGSFLNGLMWIPYQTQLAYGWTGLGIRINVVAILIIVPAILWVTPRYGAEGAAFAWVCLNLGYVMIGVQFMYRRILCAEKWIWYQQDIFQPIVPAIVIAVLLRWLLPHPVSSMAQMLTLAIASGLTLMAAGLAAELVRRQVRIALTSFFHPLEGK